MSKMQIGILSGLALLTTLVFYALGYIALGDKNGSKVPIQPTKDDKGAQIAELVALYDGGPGSLNELCATMVAITGTTLPPEAGIASYYVPSQTNHYWMATLDDPGGSVWTVACMSDVSVVTAQGTIRTPTPMLMFLYNTADECIYPQGQSLISLLWQMGYKAPTSGQFTMCP